MGSKIPCMTVLLRCLIVLEKRSGKQISIKRNTHSLLECEFQVCIIPQLERPRLSLSGDIQEYA